MGYLIAQLFGTVNNPTNYANFQGGGLARFITNIISLLIVAAGIYAVFNFIAAGYSFMSAGGDAKKVADAWAKIWQTLLGVTFAAGALIIGALVSQILFGSPTEIFNIRVYGP